MWCSLACWGFILFSTNVVSCFTVCACDWLVVFLKKLPLFKVSFKRVTSIFPSTFQGTYLECVLYGSFLRDVENLYKIDKILESIQHAC